MYYDLPRHDRLGPDPEPPGDRMDFLMSRDASPRRTATKRRGRRLRVVVAGGGPAAIEAVLTLRDLAAGDVDIHLLAPNSEFFYRPLSVTEPFANGRAQAYPLACLRELGVTLHEAGLAEIDPAQNIVITPEGERIPYDSLIVATGARMLHTVPRALTFTGPESIEPLHGLVQDIEEGWYRSVTFYAPPGANWTLPLYELALQTAERVDDLCLDHFTITLVTHEQQPLEAFGEAGRELGTRLLADARIQLITGAQELPEGLRRDRVVALPVPAGRVIPGLPRDASGFIPVDEHGRVALVPGVYAAGDGCNASAIKQGGLATQQAGAAAEAVLADAGLMREPDVAQPQLRAMLITGSAAHYLRVGPSGRAEASVRPLWWPPAKIAGRRLAPFLDSLDADAPYERTERRFSNASRRRRIAIVGGAGATVLRSETER